MKVDYIQVGETNDEYYNECALVKPVTDSEVQESEFVTGGYMDLINNYQN